MKKTEKPKRFVDLLSEGVEFVKDSDGKIWNYKDNEFRMYLSNNAWEIQIGADNINAQMFRPATPAQNPEKKKRVVYQVLYRSGYDFLVSVQKYESRQKFEQINQMATFIQLIEESREEIEE